MKKIIAICILVCSFSLLTGCNKSLDEVVLTASDANVSGYLYEGDNDEFKTKYDSQEKAIVNVSNNTEIEYTVPENVDGSYDIYVNVGRTPFQMNGGSTPISITINDEKMVPSLNLKMANADGSNKSEMGTFLVKEKVKVKTNDKITITINEGFIYIFNDNVISGMPVIGDVLLYSTGKEVKVGYENEKVLFDNTIDSNDQLSGLNIAWLGSSVTHGLASDGYSMANAIEDNHTGTRCYKYAISGTTLVNNGVTSYVERVKEIDKSVAFDMLIVQLSTNDASQNLPLGSISESKDISLFDDQTIIGAMEYLIAYTKDNLKCPIVFYTGTYYEDQNYANMIDALMELQKKWDLEIIDLWHNEEMKNIYGTEEYTLYMQDDGIHPTLKGYNEWWTPVFEKEILSILS